MTATFLIKKYQLHYFGGEEYGDHHFGWIDFKDENDFHFGRINFFEKGHLPEHTSHDRFWDNRTRYFIAMNSDKLPAVLDLLRNESPVRFFYGSPTWAKIFSGDEIPGEDDQDNRNPTNIVFKKESS